MVKERREEGEVERYPVMWQQSRSNQHLLLVENEELSSIFKVDTLHLQWSSYLLAALSFFQAVRFFQITSRLLRKKRSLNNTPSCKKTSHKNFQLCLGHRIDEYGFSGCRKTLVKVSSPKSWDSFLQHSSHAYGALHSFLRSTCFDSLQDNLEDRLDD